MTASPGPRRKSVALRVLAGTGAALMVGATVPLGGPAAGAPVRQEAYGGFATSATATPLRVEVHEPAIPIPAEPQAELNFSYSHVEGSTGPAAKARASAMWPGAAVGEGLKTIVEQAGLPAQLGAAGYPVQVNAESPGDSTSASQEYFPGMVGRVNTTDKHAIAKAGYSTSGDVAGQDADPSDSGGTSKPANPLDALKNGDLSALGGLLTGTKQGGPDTDPPAANPLGALGILVSVGGMSSASRTDYVGDAVSAKATSQLGQVSLLAGLVTLDGITVTTTATSSIGEAKTAQKVSYGGITIAGVPFALTSDGIVAAGKTSAIPGLSDLPTKALEQLGISIDLPKPERSVKGTKATVSAAGPTVTIDTGPLRKMAPAALTSLIGQIADKLPDQAGQLKSILLAAGDAHPKVVVALGSVSSQAETVPAFGSDGGGLTPTPTGDTPAASGGSAGGSGGGDLGGAGTTGDTGETPAAAGAPSATTPLDNVSATPGLPPLGSVPGMLTLLAIALGGFTGWWLRRGAGLLFGAGGTCPHGLESGLPDLRKV